MARIPWLRTLGDRCLSGLARAGRIVVWGRGASSGALAGCADRISLFPMHIAFYAPLKAPTHSVPSGDRRVARLLMQALELAGHRVELASGMRSLDAAGNPENQRVFQSIGAAQAKLLLAQWQGRPLGERPELWLTYHLYYKAADWIGPQVCSQLGIPYVACEASHAPKRAFGPWQHAHESVTAAIAQADLLLAPTSEDIACLKMVAGAGARIERLPPFLDQAPFVEAALGRTQARAELAAAGALDLSQPWLLAVGMMRPGDKLASYRELASALEHLLDLSWQLLVVGEGAARNEVRELLERAAPGRAKFLGLRQAEEMPAVYAAADLCVWPAVNEAYGMALLEAQAAGLPVVACARRGVPEVVRHGESGLLVPGGDTLAMAFALRTLLTDPERMQQMGAAAVSYVRREHSIDGAAAKLDLLLRQVVQGRTQSVSLQAKP